MQGANRTLHLTVPDREMAEKICDAVAELTGERPEPKKAYVVAHPGVTEAEGYAILAMARGLRKNYIYPETIRGVADGSILAWAIKFFHSFRDHMPMPSGTEIPFDLNLISSKDAGPPSPDAPTRNGYRERGRRGPRRPL